MRDATENLIYFSTFRLIFKSFNYLLRCEKCLCKVNVVLRFVLSVTALSVCCCYDNIKKLMRNVTEKLTYFLNFCLLFKSVNYLLKFEK